MPFQSVADLRKSDVFQRMPTLQNMSTAKLNKFVATFNNVHARALRNGASQDEAEISALRIALAAAKKAESVAARPLEDTVSVFALMTADMFSSDDGADTGLVFPDVETMNDVMAGNPFNMNHDHSDQMGVIREVVATKDLPEELRSKVDPDVRVVVKASFFSDVPPEDRHDTVSAEWFQPELKNGLQLAIPHTFAVTSVAPANGQELGIGRVAGTDGSLNAYEGDSTLSGSMGGEPEKMADLETKVADLTTELQTEREKHASLAEQVASFDEVKLRLAALAGEKKTPEEVDVKSVVASLDSLLKENTQKLASTEKRLEEIIQADREQKANAFADEVFENRDVSAEGRDTWAALHLKDPEGAEKLASTLPARPLLPGRQSSVENIAPLGDAEEKQWQEQMASTFKAESGS